MRTSILRTLTFVMFFGGLFTSNAYADSLAVDCHSVWGSADSISGSSYVNIYVDGQNIGGVETSGFFASDIAPYVSDGQPHVVSASYFNYYGEFQQVGSASVSGCVVAPPNDASYVYQEVPTTMVAGESYNVSVTMMNTGTNTWEADSPYRLGAQNPRDNNNWNIGRLYLTSAIASGEEVTFNFTVFAPSTPGSYNFQWQMVKDGEAWFGELTPSILINVIESGTGYQPPTGVTSAGEYVNLISSITVNPYNNVVIASSTTEMSYYTQPYYQAIVESNLYRQGNGNPIAVAQDTNTIGYDFAAVAHTSASGSPEVQYNLVTKHWLQPFPPRPGPLVCASNVGVDYLGYTCSNGCYYDFARYRFFDIPGTYGPSKTIFPDRNKGYQCWIGPIVLGTTNITLAAVPVPVLEGPEMVTRGNVASFTVRNLLANARITWRFSDGTETISKATTAAFSTWAGKMVASGSVSAAVVQGGRTFSLYKNVKVSGRTNFALPTKSKIEVNNGFVDQVGVSWRLSSPPVDGGLLGRAVIQMAFTYSAETIQDNGPNNGYKYITSISDTENNLVTVFFYLISPDLKNTSSAFYQAQCGNYSATTNPRGFISGAALLDNTKRHEAGSVAEYGPEVKSHYNNYVVANTSPRHNLGITAESSVGRPSISFDSFRASVTTRLRNSRTAITSATSYEHCGGNVSNDNNCNFQGFVNYLNPQTGAYAPCSPNASAPECPPDSTCANSNISICQSEN